MGEAILIGKLLDIVIIGLDAAASRKVNITALAAEIQAAHDEGRDANVQMFKDQAEAAQARAGEHFKDV